jgi:hypothetical protein
MLSLTTAAAPFLLLSAATFGRAKTATAFTFAAPTTAATCPGQLFVQKTWASPRCSSAAALHSAVPSGTGFDAANDAEAGDNDGGTATAIVDANESESSGGGSNIPNELQDMSAAQVRDLLVDLLPRMTGQKDEFRRVENYINALEDKYVPVQTLDFLNLAVGGDWQLLFSTNRLGIPNTKLRLRELVQRIDTKNLNGTVTNVARWDLAQEVPGMFDCTGTFSVKCDYSINQGARMNVELRDHVLELARGSKVPTDIEGLVGMLSGAMPSELFDPNELAMDTTYLDEKIRIVRLTGSRLEGVRNVFMRSNAVAVSPTKN